MLRFIYNDLPFSLEATGRAWDIIRHDPHTGHAVVATGLFSGLDPQAALARAQALVQQLQPVGARCIGPDVAHPCTVSTPDGPLKIIGPGVGHPNFVRWTVDSSSFAPLR